MALFLLTICSSLSFIPFVAVMPVMTIATINRSKMPNPMNNLLLILMSFSFMIPPRKMHAFVLTVAHRYYLLE